jgi:SAM-dependent methyltransferase
MNPAAEILAQNEYVRQRIAPRPGDPDYLCLVDLLAALKSLAPADVDKMLDYGCGGSPYRSLFSAGTYHRADLAGGADLDFAYGGDSMLPADIGGYDLVLSSQVLEHVIDPDAYLAECLRVLRPGGKLLLTTHGSFWDHGCPHDYWRWTAHGLKRLITRAGFQPDKLLKITANERAKLFIAEKQFGWRARTAGAYGALYDASVALMRRIGDVRRHRMADACFPADRMIDATDEQSDVNLIYVGVGALATKPA